MASSPSGYTCLPCASLWNRKRSAQHRISCAYAPRPLRNFEEPDGIAGLTGLDLQQVSAANILYAFCAAILELCCKLFMLENPRNFLFWLTTAWRKTPSAKHLIFAEHQTCGYGGKRPEWTRLATNFQQVATINAGCPQNY